MSVRHSEQDDLLPNFNVDWPAKHELDIEVNFNADSPAKPEPELEEPSQKKEFWSQSWKKTVAAGAVVAVTVCCINIAVFVWAKVQFPSSDSDGVTTVFTGSCATTKRVSLWTDLAVNVLSTILLGASNHCAQLLSSSSRAEIDKAHAKGKWLDVGVPSLRNLTAISGWRVTLWAVLYLSSVPLHLLSTINYNSVVFTTLSANDYQAALVTPGFLTGGWWNERKIFESLFYEHDQSSRGIVWYSTTVSWELAYVEQLHDMQDHIGRLHRLENDECVKAYGTSMFESDWGSVLVVSNLNLSDNVVEVWAHSPVDDGDDESWICYGRNDGYYGPCNVQSILARPSAWIIRSVQKCGLVDRCPSFSAKVDYCLAEYSPRSCTVRINTYILLVVVGCNMLKAACLILTLRSRTFLPLATTGDALASFLEHPEASTKDLGPISVMDVRKAGSRAKRRRKGKSLPLRQFKPQARRWARAVSVSRWCFCWFLCLSCLPVILYWLVWFSSDLTSFQPQAIGSLRMPQTVTTLGHNLLVNVLVANTPQTGISFIYLVYTHAFTCMVSAYEWGKFSQVRKPLRVSRPCPRTAQRSTYWLNLPYRFIVPIMGLVAILHWLSARSIFFVQLTPYDINGVAVPAAKFDSCAISVTAIFYATVIIATLVVALLGFSLCSLPPGMPIAGSCSLAISAAAHAAEGEDDPGALPLMYGVLETDSRDGLEEVRVGFSSRAVSALKKGKGYPVHI